MSTKPGQSRAEQNAYHRRWRQKKVLTDPTYRKQINAYDRQRYDEKLHTDPAFREEYNATQRRQRRKHYRNDPQYRARQQKISRERNRKLRRSALEILGGKCVRCGFSDFRALQIDHINGGGTKERREKRNPLSFYRNIANGNTEGLQCLCANCNWIKRHENGEHASPRITESPEALMGEGEDNPRPEL